MRDYIVAHYRLNQRTDTAFWRDNAANQNLSDSLKAMVTAWFTHADMGEVNARTYAEPAYAAMSWHALFAGYGTFPPPDRMQPPPPGVAVADVEAARAMLAACEQNFAGVSG